MITPTAYQSLLTRLNVCAGFSTYVYPQSHTPTVFRHLTLHTLFCARVSPVYHTLCPRKTHPQQYEPVTTVAWGLCAVRAGLINRARNVPTILILGRH